MTVESPPLAADPTNPTPGFWLTVDLLRSTTSPGVAGLRALIISPKQTGVGDIVANTEVRPVCSADDVKTAAGRCLGFLAMVALLANDTGGPLVDLVCPTESGGAAATATITFAAAPTSNQVFEVAIQGVEIQLPWNYGDANTVARDLAVAAINLKADELFCVASAGAGGVVNLTANSKGPAGNDIALRCRIISGAGGTLTASGALFTGGTTEPDFTTALATVEGREYDFIIGCVSNADAQSASTSNPSRIEDHIDALKSGRTAKLQQAHLASTGTIAQAATGSIARNSEYMTHLVTENAESLPSEFAGADCGDRMKRRRLEKNANRCFTLLKGLHGAHDKIANNPTDAEGRTALTSGVSLCGYTANDELVLLRSVTTHSQDSSGSPDRRCFDTNEVDAIFELGKDLRTYLPQQYLTSGSQVKVVADTPEGQEPPPKGVVECRDIKATITKRIRDYWVPQGVIDRAAFLASIEPGEFIVQVNATDETQVDIFIPAKAVKILAKLGVYLAKTG